MVSISEIKSRAWTSLSGRWGNAILALLVYVLLTVGASLIPLGSLLIGGPLSIGIVTFFLFLARGDEIKVGFLFDPFNKYGNALLAYFLKMIVILLSLLPLLLYLVGWFLVNGTALEADMISTGKIIGLIITLLILYLIPIYVGVRLSMMFYIISDNPQVSADKALEISWKMMKDFVWLYILLILSFILWYLLSVITLGIALLWVVPYVQTATAHFYFELKNSMPEYANMIDSYGLTENVYNQARDMYLNKDE